MFVVIQQTCLNSCLVYFKYIQVTEGNMSIILNPQPVASLFLFYFHLIYFDFSDFSILVVFFSSHFKKYSGPACTCKFTC